MSALRQVAASAALSLCLGVLLSSCGGAQTPTRERAEVRFILEPDTARVYTDERFVGGARVLAARAPSFPAGPRRFTITAEGYFPHDVEVNLPAGVTTVRLSLRAIPR